MIYNTDANILTTDNTRTNDSKNIDRLIQTCMAAKLSRYWIQSSLTSSTANVWSWASPDCWREPSASSSSSTCPLLRQTQSLRPVTRSPQRRTPSPCRRSAARSGCAHNMPYLVQSSQSCKFFSSRPWKNPATPSKIFLNANEILYWAINVSKRPPGLTC